MSRNKTKLVQEKIVESKKTWVVYKLARFFVWTKKATLLKRISTVLVKKHYKAVVGKYLVT